jgi:hypothetical protein
MSDLELKVLPDVKKAKAQRGNGFLIAGMLSALEHRYAASAHLCCSLLGSAVRGSGPLLRSNLTDRFLSD